MRRRNPCKTPRSLNRYAIRDFAGDTVAMIHARSYTQASGLAARDGLPVNELEDCGPSPAFSAHVERTPALHVLTLRMPSEGLDAEPTPLSERLRALSEAAQVVAFAEDEHHVYHLLRLGRAAARDLFTLAREEDGRTQLLEAVTTHPQDPARAAPFAAQGVHIRTRSLT